MKPSDKNTKKKTTKKPASEKQAPTSSKENKRTIEDRNEKQARRQDPKDILDDRPNEDGLNIQDNTDKGLDDEYGLNDENLFML